MDEEAALTPPMFTETPSADKVNKAGAAGNAAGQAGVRAFEIMTYHERRLSHEIIELRSEQQKLSTELAQLKIQMDSAKMSNNASDKSSLQATSAALDAIQIPTPAPAPAPAVQEPVPSRDLGTQQEVKALSNALSQMEVRTKDAIEKLTARCDATQKAGEAATQAARQAATQAVAQQNFGPKVTTGPEAVGRVDLDRLRDETQSWRQQTDTKIMSVEKKLEKVHKELPLVALKTSRIALRAVDMKPQDRRAALAVMEFKEDQMGKNPGGGKPGAPGVPGVPNMANLAQSPATSPPVTPRTDLHNRIMEISNLAPLSAAGDSAPPSGATTPRSVRSMGIPDEMAGEAFHPRGQTKMWSTS